MEMVRLFIQKYNIPAFLRKKFKYLFDWHCLLYLITMMENIRHVQMTDSKIQKMVEDAGCPFVIPKQLLVRNVCLLPDYQQNELPDNENGITRVDFYLQEALVLEIDEKKDKIKVKISQLIEWGEPRLRANFSAV